MPYRIVAEQALARWRAAQAQLEVSPPDSPEWQAASIEAELARAAYHEAVEAASSEHLHVPPPFEEATTR